jgi:hypothetical protein
METIIILLIILCCLLLFIGTYLCKTNQQIYDAFSNLTGGNKKNEEDKINNSLQSKSSNTVYKPLMLNSMTSPQMSNPQMSNPMLNPQMANPMANPMVNPQMSNPLLNPQMSNPQISNPKLNQETSDMQISDTEPIYTSKINHLEQHYYNISNANGYWDGNSAGMYTCPNAPNVNVTGGNGNWKNYCIFNTAEDAQNYCNSSPSCLGYVTNGPNMFQATNHPVKDPNGGVYYKKMIGTKSQHSYNEKFKSGWWDGNKPGVYTCPGATNRNTTDGGGNWDNYCIFNTPQDAQNYCDTDPSCLGYVTNGTNLFQATNNPVPSNEGGAYYQKQ